MAGELRAGAGLLLCILIIVCSCYSSLCDGSRSDLRNLFFDHAVVYPTVYPSNSREKRDIFSRKLYIPHEEKLTISFVAFNKTYIVKLHMNKELLSDLYFEKHHENGESVTNHPKEKAHCHYQGYLEDTNDSWAAISTCNGISGVIFDGSDVHYIEPDHAQHPTVSNHFLFRSSDMKPQNVKCGVSDNELFPSRHLVLNELQRHRRSAVIQEPYKSNSKSRYVELVIVNDNLEYKKFNRSKSVVFERSKQIANIVNGLYSPLNIFIALVGVIVWSEHDEITLSTDGDETLINFLHYRRERLSQEHPNDNAQLITAMTFDGGVVGKALKGPLCTFEFSGGVNMDHSELVGLVATTVAHEIGHNFGLEHDTDECKCPSDKCIMSPSSSSTSPKHWSSCSLEYLDLAYSHGMEYCLRNKPTNIVGPICGNGFLEEGEECDCGLKEFCTNPCCNSTSCKFYANATCAIGACCDVSTCEVKKAAVLCRESTSECDFPEYCDGKSEFCPVDTYFQNGESCGSGKAFCYDGLCRSHTDQCKLLWGETGKMSDEKCYEQNFKGDVNGNCGFNRLNQTYKSCHKKDILCGMLHCTHLNEKLEFGMESAATLARSYITVRGKILTCRSAIVDLGLYDADPGLVPNGAKCGDGKVCVKQKCVSLESIKETKCPLGCSGNGICNNKGHCHCFEGYGPPYCNTPGPGGSVDSGPASDPGGYGVVIALYVIFLGLIPLIVISAGSAYYFRPHFKAWWVAKARKANIKCRAKQAIQNKPQLPSKFNFDRNSLRTLEISAPIQQTSTVNSLGSVQPQKDRPSMEISAPTSHCSTMLQTNRPVPVRPAPPRPDVAPQRTPSWASTTSSMSRAVVRTSSLRVPDSNAASRPLSMTATRPNCPPPRPPPPKPSSIAPKNGSSSLTYEDTALNDPARSITPNSSYYDDCQTLDFSNTALAFVHQTDPIQLKKKNSSSQDKPLIKSETKHPAVFNSKQNFDRGKSFNKSAIDTHKKAVIQCTGRTGPSVVASLAKKFEKQNCSAGSASTGPSSMEPPFKTRPLPPTPNNPKI